ncbi:MAG TPA: T9SS type A sorting domain-containing protein [Bacteroidales bacterium]|nr:T9SS type A sorting domain-containing protein [Bacteroidales bacterium]
MGKRRTTWLNVELSPAEDGIGTENSSLNIRIYPNPVTDGGLFISSDQNPGFIELINSAGIRVFYDYSEETEICIGTSELASGIYLIRIHNDRGYITKKIIVF